VFGEEPDPQVVMVFERLSEPPTVLRVGPRLPWAGASNALGCHPRRWNASAERPARLRAREQAAGAAAAPSQGDGASSDHVAKVRAREEAAAQPRLRTSTEREIVDPLGPGPAAPRPRLVRLILTSPASFVRGRRLSDRHWRVAVPLDCRAIETELVADPGI
jgi:hypothetical protein